MPSPNMGSEFSANTATSYPFSWDGRRLTFGKYKGSRFWDVTGLSASSKDYCLWVMSTAIANGNQATPQLREFAKYLEDRGFPFQCAPSPESS